MFAKANEEEMEIEDSFFDSCDVPIQSLKNRKFLRQMKFVFKKCNIDEKT